MGSQISWWVYARPSEDVASLSSFRGTWRHVKERYTRSYLGFEKPLVL